MIVNTLWGQQEVQSKKCIKCGEEKSIHEFSIRNNKNEKRNDCRKCHTVNKKLIRRLQKEHTYPDKDYKCPCCNRTAEEVEDMFSNRRAWALDHDHKTGKFRGWICSYCNIGLANFNDDPIAMKRAIEYLQKSL